MKKKAKKAKATAETAFTAACRALPKFPLEIFVAVGKLRRATTETIAKATGWAPMNAVYRRELDGLRKTGLIDYMMEDGTYQLARKFR